MTKKGKDESDGILLWVWMSEALQCEAWSLRDRGQTAGQVGDSDQDRRIMGKQILPDVAASILEKIRERGRSGEKMWPEIGIGNPGTG